MPNLPMHIFLAHQVAEELDWGYVRDHLGSCLFGSTVPDIRAMTRWPREQTHFAPISVQSVGTGTRRMFELHPEMADNSRLDPATRAFILGYVSHLTADEVWITTMFRPHFEGEDMVAGSEVEAHIWDRALQLDMDRQARQDTGGFARAAPAIACADRGVELAFLERAVLDEWQAWVERFLGWEFSWDRLKRALNRMFRDDDQVQQAVDRFIREMPRSLERVYEIIPPEKLAAYQRRVLDQTLVQVREYLSEA